MWGTNPAIQRLQAERALPQDSGGLFLLFLAVYFGTFEQGGRCLSAFHGKEEKGGKQTLVLTSKEVTVNCQMPQGWSFPLQEPGGS